MCTFTCFLIRKIVSYANSNLSIVYSLVLLLKYVYCSFINLPHFLISSTSFYSLTIFFFLIQLSESPFIYEHIHSRSIYTHCWRSIRIVWNYCPHGITHGINVVVQLTVYPLSRIYRLLFIFRHLYFILEIIYTKWNDQCT